MPALLLACFVLSGASGLLLEVVWVRELTHVFGSTTLAISTVLATFMGGLALGSWVGGRVADRLRDPLRGYAVCEAGIGVCAMAVPWILGAYPEANAWLWRTLGDAPVALAVARLGMSALVLGLPTVLMGATLPLLSRRVARAGDDAATIGRKVGLLYAANTVGAVLGVVVGGFWLIPMVGVRRTNWIAVVLDLALAAAVAAWALRARGPGTDTATITETDHDHGSGHVHVHVNDHGGDHENVHDHVNVDRSRALVLVAFGLSGALAMSLEVLYSRALSMIIGSSGTSFTLVLAVFLVGLAAGAASIGRPAARTTDPLGALALVFLGIGVSVGASHLLLDDLPAVRKAISTRLRRPRIST